LSPHSQTRIFKDLVFQWPERVQKLKWSTAAFLLVAVFVICNLRLVTGKSAPIWDAWAFYGPEFTLIADHARTGHFLLWDPWVNGGSPDHADPTVGAASPIEVLVAAVASGSSHGFVAYWLIMWVFGPLGLLALGRHLGAPAWGTLIIAFGMAFCSFYTGHSEHTSFVYSYSFVPWFIWRLDKALISRRVWPAIQGGALWGLSALGGYPQLTFLSGGFLALWAAGRTLSFCSDNADVENAHIAPRLAFTFVALVVTFTVGSIVLAPSYVGLFTEGAGYTDRAGELPRKIAVSSNELDPGTLLTFASPYLHLLKYPGVNPGLWPNSDVSVIGNYIGALPLIFALIAIVMRPTSGWRLWLLGIGIVFMLCAVGDHLPVRGWLYDFVPLTRYFRHPGAFRGYAMFCAAVLAMIGTKDFQYENLRDSVRIWNRLATVSVVTTIAAVFGYYKIVSSGLHLAADFSRANSQMMIVWVSSCAIVLFALLSPKARKAMPLLFCLLALADVFYTARISQPLISNAGFFGPLWAQADANHKDGLALAGLDRQIAPPGWLPKSPNDVNIPLKIPTLFNDATMANHFHLGLGTSSVLSNMATGRNRVWFADKTAAVAPSDAAYAEFLKRTDAIGSPIIVVHEPKEMFNIGRKNATLEPADAETIAELPAAHQVAADVLTYTPNQLAFNVRCPADGYLLLTDRWSRDWVATVNDSSVQVLGGDFVFRAVRVHAGDNRIEFFYRPTAWWELLLLSWLTLLMAFTVPYIRFVRDPI